MFYLKFSHPILYLLFLVACSKPANLKEELAFEREIELPNRWTYSEIVVDESVTQKWIDTLSIKYSSDKVYLVDVNHRDEILSFWFNGSDIQPVTLRDGWSRYNVTNYLNQTGEYAIELHFKHKEGIPQSQDCVELPFEARLHCLNKFFIAGIDLKAVGAENSGIYDFKVLIKNLNRFERQGQIKFALSDPNHDSLFEGHSPVFLDGNSENLFHKEIRISHLASRKSEVKVACSLYWMGLLYDQEIYTP